MGPEFLQLLNLGVAGVLIILLNRGDLVPRSVLNREIERGDKATAAAQATGDALTTVTDTMKEQNRKVIYRLASIEEKLGLNPRAAEVQE